MERDAARMRYCPLLILSPSPCPSTLHILYTVSTADTSPRDGGPTIFAEVKNGKGVDHIVGLILSAWKASGAYEVSRERWKRNGALGGEV